MDTVIDHHLYPNFVVYLLILLFLPACERSMIQPTTGPGLLLPLDTLYSTTWVLESYGDPSNQLSAPSANPVTIIFDRNHRLSGYTGCNQYSSQFTAVVGGEIRVTEEIITTQIQCPETQVAFETLYLQALAAVKYFGVSQEGKLELSYPSSNGSNHQLVFTTSIIPLELTTWRLDQYGEPNNFTPVLDETNVLLEFSEQGLLNGFSGCNPFRTSYILENSTLAIDPIESPIIPCGDEQKAQQEKDFISILERVTYQRVSNGKLTISSQDGLELIFSPYEFPVEGLVWTLIPEPVASYGAGFTFSFFLQPSGTSFTGTISGFSGCNQFNGNYQIHNQVLRITDLKATGLKCSGTVTNFEQAILKKLLAGLDVRMVGDRLHLSVPGFSVEFSSSTLFLNSTAWRLIGAQAFDVSQAVPSSEGFSMTWVYSPGGTMGIVSGATPCGDFSGLYSFETGRLVLQNLEFEPADTCTANLSKADLAWVKDLPLLTHAQLIRDRLILSSQVDHRSLIFQAFPLVLSSPILPRDEMTLVSIDGQETTAGITTSIHFQRSLEGILESIHGLAGCNYYWAEVNSTGIGKILTGRDLCEDRPQAMQQEQRFLTLLMDSGLSPVTAVQKSDSQWITNSPQGPLLFQTPLPFNGSSVDELLTGDEWILLFKGESAVIPETGAFPKLSFSSDHSFTGSTGCSMITGTYTFEEDLFSMQLLDQEICQDKTLLPLEENFLELFPMTTPVDVTKHILQLGHGAETAVFIRNASEFISSSQEPLAIIQAPQQALVRSRVIFDASLSKSLEKIKSYRWEFGDGKRSAKGVTSHTYRKPGFYNLRLTVTDQAGRTNSAEMVIEIVSRFKEAPSAPPSPTLQPGFPTAVIQSPQKVKAGEVVTLDGKSSISANSPINQFQWDYGDGSGVGASDKDQVQLIYNRPGNYLVTLTVTDESGASSSSSKNLQVNQPLEGAAWGLESMDSWLSPGSLILIEFDQGKLMGFSGCNLFQAEISFEPAASFPADLSISQLEDEPFACPASFQQQEIEFFEVLNRIQSYRIETNKLILSYPEGELIFHAVIR